MMITGEDARVDAYFVHVDPAYPDAPNRPLGREVLAALMRSQRYRHIVIVIGDKQDILGPDPKGVARRLSELQG
jgi:hypothetical protein